MLGFNIDPEEVKKLLLDNLQAADGYSRLEEPSFKKMLDELHKKNPYFALEWINQHLADETIAYSLVLFFYRDNYHLIDSQRSADFFTQLPTRLMNAVLSLSLQKRDQTFVHAVEKKIGKTLAQFRLIILVRMKIYFAKVYFH